ncbi:hypothetical protein BGZ47_004492 [Haplosporangium gracile]|nr:hypothetical protein BGZ47_004492 [Haplosporangium gracile]
MSLNAADTADVEAVKMKFYQLKRLYRQIEVLTELSHLDFCAVSVGDDGRSFVSRCCTASTEQLLQNLRVLSESVSAVTDKSKTKMEWPEAPWMAKYWLNLEFA